MKGLGNDSFGCHESGAQDHAVVRHHHFRVHAAAQERVASSLFQLGQQAIPVAVFTKFVEIHATVLLLHVAFERAQQIVRAVIQQFGFGIGVSLGCRFHELNGTQIELTIQLPILFSKNRPAALASRV